ncbi:MAG: hypothetical protein ACRC62_22005 [Microcoleus sp.]
MFKQSICCHKKEEGRRKARHGFGHGYTDEFSENCPFFGIRKKEIRRKDEGRKKVEGIRGDWENSLITNY